MRSIAEATVADGSEREKPLYRDPRSMRSADSFDRCSRVRLLTFSTLPCRRSSSSLVEASKLMKYGSRSSSLRLAFCGGKRPNICGPGIVCAAAEGNVECSGGEAGVPLEDVVLEDLSFAEEDGTGRKACAGDGLAGSRGGAFKLFFGTEDAG